MSGGETSDILLVEDSPDDVELTLRALQRAHIANRIHVARDGKEALVFLFGESGKTPRPDLPVLILLDVRLPKVSGLEVLRRHQGRAPDAVRPGRHAQRLQRGARRC